MACHKKLLVMLKAPYYGAFAFVCAVFPGLGRLVLACGACAIAVRSALMRCMKPSKASRASSLPQGWRRSQVFAHTENHCGSELARDWAFKFSEGLKTDQPSSPSSSSPPSTFIPNSLILRVKVLRPQPSSTAASRRRPAVCLRAVSIMIRSKLGTALSSRLD